MRRRSLAVMTVLAGGLAACGDILDAELPGVVDVRTLDDPALADLLVTGVIADFECAYNNYTFGSSAMADEWWHSSGGQVYREWGGRLIDENHVNYISGTCEGGGFGQYAVIQTARFQAEDAYRRLTEFSADQIPGDKTQMLATARAYAGYSYVLLGENFCEMAVDGGPIMQPAQVLAIAEERFLEAIDLAQQAGDEDILSMARVGLARARRGMGDLAGAADVARQVPAEFVYYVARDETPQRRWNKGYDSNSRRSDFTVAPSFRGVEWKGVPDPRVALENKGVIAAYGVDWWAQTKYLSAGADIPLATWVEAQLIIAEAEGGQAAVDIVNKLHDRAAVPPFDPATDVIPGPTADNILNMVIEQRRREFFLEGGHRLNDMLRYGIPLFSGVDHLGREYGDTTCWPLPTLERQGNPNIGGA